MSNVEVVLRTRRTIEELRVLSTKIPSKELVYYCRNIARPTMAGEVLKMEQSDGISDLNRNILNDCDSRQLKVLLLMTEQEQVDTQVTTFNVCKALSEDGYKFEYASNVKHDVTQTLSTGYDGTAFPTEHGKFIVISKGNEVAYAPIRNSLIDTNYLKFSGFKFVTFHLEFAQVSRMLTTFFEMRNGKVLNISASEAGEQLLNFKHYLGSKYKQTIGVAIDYINDAIKMNVSPDPRGWPHTSLTGPMFAHFLYIGMARAFTKEPDSINTLMLVMEGLFGSQVVKGRSVNVVALKERKIVITHKPISIPQSLNSVMMNLTKKLATLDQAYLALSYSRGFHGTNTGEKSADPRTAYFVCNASPEIAELSYMVTNLGRFIDKIEHLLLYVNPNTHGNAAKTILDSLVALNFRGEVFIPRIPHIVAMMKPVKERCSDGEHEPFDRDYYEYARAAFKVFIMHEDVSSYCIRGSWYYKQERAVIPNEKTVILDWRPLDLNLSDRKKIMLSEEVVEGDLATRLNFWRTCSYPVISRASLFRNLVNKPLSVVTGVELHDLVMWVGHNIDLAPKDTDWWYILKTDNFSEICAASILCNFARTIRSITGVSPYALLSHLKYKVPIVSVVGLGKPQIGVTQYSIITAALAEIERGGDIQSFFATQTVSNRAALLTSEIVMAAVNNAPIQVENDTEGSTNQSMLDFSFGDFDQKVQGD